MISGATHTLSVDLIKSMQDFRSRLDQQSSMNVNEISKTQELAENTEPSEKIEAPQQLKETNIDYEALNADIESSSSTIEPVDVYKTSMKYSQRMDLISAFESVGQDDSNRPHISVLA